MLSNKGSGFRATAFRKTNSFHVNNNTPENTCGGIMIGYKSIIAVLSLLAIPIGCSQQVHLLKSGVESWNK
jgi:hypothetical protein